MPKMLRRFVSTLVVSASAVAPFAGFVPAAVASNAQPGALYIGTVVASDSAGFHDLMFSVRGARKSARWVYQGNGLAKFTGPAGEYDISANADEPLKLVFGGDCDENGSVTIIGGETVSCTVTVSDDVLEENVGGAGPDSVLIVEKRFVGGAERDPKTSFINYSSFAFSVNGEETAFWQAGVNTVEVPAGKYTVSEKPAEGYVPSYSGDCDANGVVKVLASRAVTCVITNTLAVGGFNPDGTPSSKPALGGIKGSVAVSGTAKPTVAPSPAVTASASPLTAAIGGDGWEACVLEGGWLMTLTIVVFALAGLLLLLVDGLRGGRAFALLLVLALILYWMGSGCADSLGWLPFVLGGVVWILLGRAPDAA